MAVAYVQEFTIVDRGTANYDTIAAKLADVQAEGLIVHTAGFDDDAGVFRIFDVWESEEHGRRFLDDHVLPLVDEATQGRSDLQPPTRDGFYELHDVRRA